VKLVPIAATLLLACAGSKAGSGPDAPPSVTPDAPVVVPTDAASPAGCPGGQLATSVATNGNVTCAEVADATAVAVRSRCSVYLGQRDSCTACTDPPTKWSQSAPLFCSPGTGTGNMCVSAPLDDAAAQLQLATLDLDGDVNDDDKLFAGLHCVVAHRPLAPAPCAAGWAVSGKQGATWMCAPVSEAAVGYVRSHCAVYLGWQDKCDGCTTPPTKWGFANDTGCSNGAGDNDTCVTTMLGSETVNLFGLNTGGDVDGNDKLHMGLHCDAPTPATSTTKTMCPDGQFVVGTNADGSFQCGDPSAAFASYVADHCSLYFGWHDSCDGCTDVPTKWGKVGTNTCMNGAGADDTCTEMTLGTAMVQMLGLSPDGNVNGDDTLYVGLRCDAL
jgi:hypothetical protein